MCIRDRCYTEMNKNYSRVNYQKTVGEGGCAQQYIDKQMLSAAAGAEDDHDHVCVRERERGEMSKREI